MPDIRLESVRCVYGAGTPFEKVALDNIDLSIPAGQYAALLGHTGSGKSTLIQHLNGLLKPDSGKVLVDGVDIWQDKETLRNSRFKVGLCFQYPEYQLFESSVYKDIAFGPHNMGLSDEEINEHVLRAADFVGIKKEMLKKSPFDLSGGEKRRVAIAGVIAMEPKVLILDEPTAGLDPKGRDTIADMIDNYRKSTGSTVIVVSHSMEDVAKSASKVLVMNKGHVEFFTGVKEVFSNVQRLVEIGLNVPQITGILMDLKAKGYNVRTDIYSVDEAKSELFRFFKERGVL